MKVQKHWFFRLFVGDVSSYPGICGPYNIPEPSKVQNNLNVWNFSPFGPLGPHQDKTEPFPTKQNGKPLLFPWQLAHVSNEHRYGIIGQLFADFSRN